MWLCLFCLWVVLPQPSMPFLTQWNLFLHVTLCAYFCLPCTPFALSFLGTPPMSKTLASSSTAQCLMISAVFSLKKQRSFPCFLHRCPPHLWWGRVLIRWPRNENIPCRKHMDSTWPTEPLSSAAPQCCRKESVKGFPAAQGWGQAVIQNCCQHLQGRNRPEGNIKLWDTVSSEGLSLPHHHVAKSHHSTHCKLGTACSYCKDQQG